MRYTWLIILTILSQRSHAQFLQDYSNIASIRHYAVDSLRIGGGVVIFDYNNDGLEDIYLAGGEAGHQLFENQGDFDFRRVTQRAGLDEVALSTFGANAADLNNDGWVDLFIGTGVNQPSVLLKNNGDGTFSDVSEGSGITVHQYWSTAVTFADFNSDGFLDIYVGNYARDPTVPLEGSSSVGAYPNELFLSTGQEFQYEEVAEETGVAGSGFTLSVRATDPDQDHDLDLYVINDFGTGGNEGNKYYENNGQGTFTEKSQELGLDLGIFGMGGGLGDYDQDGDFDWYLSDIGQNHLLRQEPDGTYMDVTTETLAIGNYISWGGEFFDSNHDTRLDLFMANGAVLGEVEQPLLYYDNLGGQYLGTQLNLVELPFFARGIAYADLDNDGDLDVVVNVVAETGDHQSPLIPVIRNTADLRFADQRYLQIQLESESFAPGAYGSILKLHLSSGRQLLRIADNGGAFASKHSSYIHYGIGTQQIDSLEVFWPDGARQVFMTIPVNSTLRIHQEEGLSVLRGTTATAVSPDMTNSISIYPIPASEQLTIVMPGSLGLQQARLYSLDGQLQRQYHFGSQQINTAELNLPEGLPPGVYLLEVIHRKGRLTTRIITGF